MDYTQEDGGLTVWKPPEKSYTRQVANSTPATTKTEPASELASEPVQKLQPESLPTAESVAGIDGGQAYTQLLASIMAAPNKTALEALVQAIKVRARCRGFKAKLGFGGLGCAADRFICSPADFDGSKGDLRRRNGTPSESVH